MINETGNTYGRLTVIKRDEEKSKKVGKTFWLCECNCKEHDKNIISALGYNLRNEKTRSCGCLSYERKSETRYNPTLSLLYKRRKAMRRRCNDVNVHGYEDYGGRGITYCKRWEKFENFKEDMLDSFIKHLDIYGGRNTTLDRIDVDGNYEPENCRWSTLKEQANNRRNNVITDGEFKIHLCDAAEKIGLSRNIVYKRLKRGWDLERALTEQPKYYNKASIKYSTKDIEAIVNKNKAHFDDLFHTLNELYNKLTTTENYKARTSIVKSIQATLKSMDCISQVLCI